MVHWRKLVFRITLIFFLPVCAAVIDSPAFASLSAEGIRVYDKQLSDEHRQTIADDISRFKQADNLWDVLRDEFSLSHYENSPQVQEKIEWFMNNQDFLLRSVNRASPYLYYILQQVKKRHLPAELVLLPIVESGYNPLATSNVGAAGIWQLMPGTATGLGLKNDVWFDGRRDVIASTRAALTYLAYLQSFFDGNWLLAIAAYNTGEGNVLSAIRRNIRDGLDTDFWSLPIATETKNYVPSILALAVIISKPNQYPVYFPPIRNAPYLAQFDVGSKISLKVIAAMAGMQYNKLIRLNPGFKRAAAKGPYKLVLPIENVEQLSENLLHSPYRAPAAPTWRHYRMKSGDTLAAVARKFNTTTDELRRFNHLSRRNPRRGTNILIPDVDTKVITSRQMASPVETQDEPMMSRINRRLIQSARNANNRYRMRPGDTIYMVRNGDSLEKIAIRFHLALVDIMRANNLRGRKVIPGKNLIIPTHAQTAASTKTNGVPAQPKETMYMVKRGDTIAKIAKRFQTSPASIRLANFIDDSSLIEGANLVIPLPVKS